MKRHVVATHHDRFVCTTQAHISAKEAGDVRIVPVDENFQLDEDLILEKLDGAAALFVTAGPPGTGVIEGPSERVHEYCIDNGIPIIIDYCGGSLLSNLPNTKPFYKGDTSPELNTQFKKLRELEGVFAVTLSTKSFGNTGGLSLCFFADEPSDCQLITKDDDSGVLSSGTEAISGTYASLTSGTYQNLGGHLSLCALTTVSKRKAFLAAEELTATRLLPILPVNMNSFIIQLESRTHLDSLMEDIKEEGSFIPASVIIEHPTDPRRSFYGIRFVMPIGIPPKSRSIQKRQSTSLSSSTGSSSF